MTKILKKNISELSSDKRANEILDVILSYARLDFTKHVNLSEENNLFDAIGNGINMLGEELQHSTVSLKEKEQLLKEVHHRVKNNLQIVCSLLNLQSDNIVDEKYLSLVRESRNRINSMALVHEMLYTSKDLSKIELKEYIERLSVSVHQSFAVPNSEIKFNYKVQNDINFEIDRMIPVGLILNEIISNSFKYAFPEKKGVITVELSLNKNSCSLQVSDNGKGLPKNFNKDKDSNLGMQLVHMLSEQIDGRVEINQNNGTEYKITFPLK